MAKTSSSEKFESGYGKPPEAHKWKKGQSGNPSGKKKMATPHLNLNEYFAGELQKLVLVTENGKQVKIPLIQLLVRRFILSTVTGKPKDFALLLQFLSKNGVFSLGEMLEEEEDVFTEEDRRLIAIAHRETFRE